MMIHLILLIHFIFLFIIYIFIEITYFTHLIISSIYIEIICVYSLMTISINSLFTFFLD